MERLVVPFLFAFAIAALPAHAQIRKLEPVDEGAADASWLKFKNQLAAALDRKDRQFVLGILDPKVRNGEGRPDGVSEFKKAWDVEQNPDALFRALRRLLFLGSIYVKDKQGTVLCAPYVTFKWPDDIDPLGAGAVLVKDALVKAKPSNDAATLTTLSYDIVEVTDWETRDDDPRSGQKWVKVKTGSGEGYVPEEQLRSAVEHRACFRHGKDGWKLTSLLAGD